MDALSGFDDRFWEITPSCPTLGATSEPRPGVTAPHFTGAGYHVRAPSGAILDRMVIWRHGYRFNSTGVGQGPWAVGGYRGDSTLIGGPLFGETCNIALGKELHCDFGAPGMAAAARVERDLETTEVLYSVSCFNEPGCGTANAEGFPFAGVFISGSIVTVREERPPTVVARGPLTAPGWRTIDAPLSFGASDPVGIRQLRVLVDGAEIHAVRPRCDFTRMAPCNQVPERPVAFGARVRDGRRTVTVEAVDTAGNVGRVARAIAIDRNPPRLAFPPRRVAGASWSTPPTRAPARSAGRSRCAVAAGGSARSRPRSAASGSWRGSPAARAGGC